MPLDDYIIAVYGLIDDLYLKLNQQFNLRKARYAPQVNNSKLITMLIIGELHSNLLSQMGNWQHFLADGVPLLICHIARAKQSTMFKDKSALHYFVAKKEHYYGFKVLIIDTGIPIDYVIDAANVNE
ncbi:MAG: hypothetical protein ACK4M7_00725 [Burkholderiales bacterium]